MAGPNATKSIFLALGANFAIAVAKGVAAFAFVPLASALELEGALREVIGNTVACNVFFSLFFSHVGSAFTDD